jgi:hypothetical protein
VAGNSIDAAIHEYWFVRKYRYAPCCLPLSAFLVPADVCMRVLVCFLMCTEASSIDSQSSKVRLAYTGIGPYTGTGYSGIYRYIFRLRYMGPVRGIRSRDLSVVWTRDKAR